jgi:hypothetical protein
MKNNTQKGLLILIIGISVGIITNISLFLLTDNLPGVLALALVGIIGVIGGLLTLVGLILIVVGRREYGEKHSKFAIYAAVIFVLSIVFATVFSIMISMINFISNSPTNTNIILLQTPITSTIGGLVYVFLLYELEDKNGKIVLFLAFIATILASIFITVGMMSLYEELMSSIAVGETSFANTFDYINKMSRTGIYSIISSGLLLIALILPYNRIKSGELVPTPPKTNSLYGGNVAVTQDRLCPNCGRIIPFDSKICPYCRKKFELHSSGIGRNENGH